MNTTICPRFSWAIQFLSKKSTFVPTPPTLPYWGLVGGVASLGAWNPGSGGQMGKPPVEQLGNHRQGDAKKGGSETRGGEFRGEYLAVALGDVHLSTWKKLETAWQCGAHSLGGAHSGQHPRHHLHHPHHWQTLMQMMQMM